MSKHTPGAPERAIGLRFADDVVDEFRRLRAVNRDLLAALKGMLAERKSHPAPPEGAAVMFCAGCIEAERIANLAIAKAEEEQG